MLMSTLQMGQPPSSEQELLSKVIAIAGYPMEELANHLSIDIPHDPVRAKGWVGTLLERWLGATATSKREPDFENIGVELKTIPIVNGEPKETTYICTVALTKLAFQTWQSSDVKKKLNRVLWLPYEGDVKIPLAKRHVGQGFIWSPNAVEEEWLKTDWQELTNKLALGNLEEVTAYDGHYMQVRPKAANNRSTCWGIGEDGEKHLTLPRGFYLRTSFTSYLLKNHYL